MLESLQTGVFEYEKLRPEEMKARGILGRLVGVMADTVNPTRNGRLYSNKLWENVFNNPIMQERIENKCCFGELGHPTDREETDMSKIAICMDGLPKRDKDGKLQAIFNILDTPNGRILKTLCDYGCNIGISSRGSGDLIQDFDGNESVDPDTYNCEGWDAVLIPAVKEARLKYVTESLEKTRYNKTLKLRLQEAIEKEDVDKKQAMTESLHAFLGESIWDEIENDSADVTEPEVGPEPNADFVDDLDVNSGEADIDSSEGAIDDFGTAEGNDDMMNLDNLELGDLDLDTPADDFSMEMDDTFDSMEPESFDYKGIRVIQDPDSGKYVCEIDQETYVFNSEKNAKIWIDMNADEVADTIQDNADEKLDELERDKHTETPEESEEELVEEEPEPVQESLVEEQVGRDTTKEDKDIDEVQEPAEEKSEEDTEEDDDKVTISIKESVSSPTSGEERVADLVLGYLEENPADSINIDNVVDYMTELDNTYYEEDIDPQVVNIMVKEKLNLTESLVKSTLPTLNYSESITEAGNAGTIDGFQELVEQNINLEKKMIELQEKLSAGNARERKLIEELATYKDKVVKLSSVAKENKALKEQLKSVKDSTEKLNESMETNKGKVRALNEKLQQITEERNSATSELESLKEEYSSLDKDFTQVKEQYSKRFDKQNKLLEKYQKITKNAVDRYINMQATNLGVKSAEIRNRLPEQFSFSDVDSICEELRDYKLNVSKLPFNTSKPLNESRIQYQNPAKGLVPRNDVDDLNDYDLKLMEMYK